MVILFQRPTKEMRMHIKPLYVDVYMFGKSIRQVLIDNGAAVNIMPTRT